MGKMRNPYKILVGKPDGKSPLGRRMRKWEDNNKMDIGEIGLEVIDWIHRAVTCKHCKEPSSSIKGGEFLG
jgi:hypothetical protein